METVVGIFDPKDVNNVLEKLDMYGFDKNQVELVGPHSPVNDPQSDAHTLGLEATPTMTSALVAANQLNPFNAGIGVVYNTDDLAAKLASLGLSDALEFYRSSLEKGASLIIVRTSVERATEARLIMRHGHATNVTEPKDLHSDQQATV